MSITQLIEIFTLPLLVAASSTYLITPLSMALYHRLGWLDDPTKTDHPKVIHDKPVPRGGGIAIFFGLLAGIVLFLGVDKHSLGILLGSLILAITGVIDDLKDISPYLRLGVGFIAASMVVAAGIGISFITNPGGGVIMLNYPQIAFDFFGQLHTIWILADALALVWIVWCMNMINWSKGLDGQLPGVVIIASIVIGILSFRFTEDITQWQVSILAGITAGAYLGYLPWNIYPQKSMPGYGGGSIAGFLLAVLAILSGAKVATLIIVLGVPMIDAVYVMARRIKQGKSPVWGDDSHLHHYLLKLGWSKRKIAAAYWIVTVILGFVALQLNPKQKVFTIAVLAVGFGILLVWIQSSIKSSRRSDLANGSKT